ncbi:hypothetical protein PV08_08368 [Exophiala spinifera]|uniref:DUF300-domain-containing protein n=1 Tax=Exophiala spinifera TaxID=91928 RepID=A0A0D1YDR0_9EURO|nr:uncharacterized protein PV08_08368 [Exophiala spinifera]KIW13181.1 hypothetical protein PV08_08368 [Exophiala spinifera]
MGLFGHDNSNHTCDTPKSFVADAPEPLVGSVTFHQLNMAISGGCVAFSTLSILILIFRHATHFSRPNEQTKILKICTLIPVYSIGSWISIAKPNSYIYITPWLEFYQGIALGSFFLLLCEYVSPSAASRDVFFAALKVTEKKRRGQDSGTGVDGLEWYRKKWFAVFQYPVIALLVAIATDVTQAANLYCLTSHNAHFAHLWLKIAIYASITMAVVAVVTFYVQLKTDLKQHKPLAKFLAFKPIIGLTFLQSILFTILRSTNVLKETSKLTWADVNFGIQTMIICVEMVPFSIFFHYAYDVGAYDLSKPRPLPLAYMGARPSPDSDSETTYAPQHMQTNSHSHSHSGEGYYGGPLGVWAWITVFNPMDILRAIVFGFSMKAESRKRRRMGNMSGQEDARMPAY